jgi:hypothetical protein
MVGMSVLVLVEGESDRAAVLALAARLGRDLGAEGVDVVAAGGVGEFAKALMAHAPPSRVVGLYDAGEARVVRQALQRSGRGDDPAAAGFHACTPDLEAELIAALGVTRVEEVIDAEGELASLRRMQRQPAQRDRPAAAQLHRFMGTRGGRKIRYGGLLVDALPLDAVPAPLARLLADV